MRDLPMIVGDSDADDAERSGEVSRKNILRAMDESGLNDNLIGSQLAGIVKDIHAPAKVRLDAIALAIDLKSAMPKRVQRHKIQSEQRVLRVSYENGALPSVGGAQLDAEKLKKLKPTERALLVELTRKMDGAEGETDGA